MASTMWPGVLYTDEDANNDNNANNGIENDDVTGWLH